METLPSSATSRHVATDTLAVDASVLLGTVSGKRRATANVVHDTVVVTSDNSQHGEISRTPIRAAYDWLAQAADATQRSMQAAYKQHEARASAWSRAGLIAAALGLMLVVATTVGVFLARFQLATYSSVVSTLIEFLSLVFFRQSASARKVVQGDQRRLAAAEGLYQAINIALTIDDSQIRDRLKVTIVKRIIGDGISVSEDSFSVSIP